MKLKRLAIAGAAAAQTLTLAPMVALAQTYEGLGGAQNSLNDVQSDSGLSNATLPELIGNLINVALGVMGIVLVVYIVWAGWIYMSSQGDPGKIDKAKKMITASVMGLILILAAYAISNYIIGALTTAAGA